MIPLHVPEREAEDLGNGGQGVVLAQEIAGLGAVRKRQDESEQGWQGRREEGGEAEAGRADAGPSRGYPPRRMQLPLLPTPRPARARTQLPHPPPMEPEQQARRVAVGAAGRAAPSHWAAREPSRGGVGGSYFSPFLEAVGAGRHSAPHSAGRGGPWGSPDTACGRRTGSGVGATRKAAAETPVPANTDSRGLPRPQLQLGEPCHGSKP